jgi:hypothetical protein
MRVDGFAYASVVTTAATGGARVNGTLTTKLLLWHGGELVINADTLAGGPGTAGSVTIVAIEDGYRTPASLPFHGNETNATVRWAGAGKMASLQGKKIQLEATITGSVRLYALRGSFTWL